MKIEELSNEIQLKKDDVIIYVTKDDKIKTTTVKQVKQVGDDTEIILNKYRNIWFSLNRYFEFSSWIKEVHVVKIS